MKIVLLGAGGTGASFAIASRIRANWGENVRLILTDIYDEHLVATSLLADKFYKVPYVSDPSYSRIIGDIILSEGVQTYIPILNDEIILAANLSRENKLNHVDFWSSDIYASCIDKIFADSWLKKIGVRTPLKINLSDLSGDSGPWFSKPRDGFGSRGAAVLTLDEAINLKLDLTSNFLIQELCRSPEITVDSFYDASADTGYAYCRERLEIKSGVCTKARLFADPELTDFSRKIGKALGQRGTICFQVMKSNEGWAVTDLNLRPGAGTSMTCSAGFDVIAAAFACRNGDDYSKFIKPLEASEEFFIARQYSDFVTLRTL